LISGEGKVEVPYALTMNLSMLRSRLAERAGHAAAKITVAYQETVEKSNRPL